LTTRQNTLQAAVATTTSQYAAITRHIAPVLIADTATHDSGAQHSTAHSNAGQRKAVGIAAAGGSTALVVPGHVHWLQYGTTTTLVGLCLTSKTKIFLLN
jgi:hypothetical protein